MTASDIFYNDIPASASEIKKELTTQVSQLSDSLGTLKSQASSSFATPLLGGINSISAPPFGSIELPSLGLPTIGTSSFPSSKTLSDELAKQLNFGGKSAASATDKLIKPSTSTVDFKAQLSSIQNPGDSVVFNVSPVIDESRSANYEHLAPVHHPGTIQVYKNTESRQFNVSVKLISRTSAEATENLDSINLIRSWVMPYYGQGTASSDEKRLGAPPDVLSFSAYGIYNIDSLPVVLTSYHWVYPDGVDYIPTNDGIPFPTIFEVSLSLVESYSPEQYTSFDITSYRIGDMTGAYSFSVNPPDSGDALGDFINVKMNEQAFNSKMSEFANPKVETVISQRRGL
jgi:hypothetical protein